MSTVPPDNALTNEPTDGSPVVGERRRWAGRGVWAILDQGMFAGANFFVTVGLAGWLTESEFGAFTSAYASFLIIGVFTTSLLTEPMMVFGSKKSHDELPAYLSKLLGAHLLITLLGGVILGAIAYWVNHHGQPLLGLAMGYLALTQVSQLIPWMTRTACYLEGNPRPAAVSGILYMVLVLGTLVTLFRLDHLTITTAIETMGLASLVVNLYLFRALRIGLASTLNPAGYGPIIRDHWRYGKWAVPTNLTHYVPEQLPFVAVPFVLGWLAGTKVDLESGGALKAMMNFAVPFVLMGWALSTLLVPMMVRARFTPRFRRLTRVMLAVEVGVPLVCWPLLGFFGDEVVGLAYRGKFVEHAWMLWIVGLIPVASGYASVLYTQLKASERPDRLFVAAVSMSVVLVVSGLPLLMWIGLPGAALAILLSYMTKAGVLVVLGRRIIAESSRPANPPAPTADRPVFPESACAT